MDCKGVLFDLDGTLINSIPLVELIWSAWAVKHNVDPAAVLAFLHGKPSVDTVRHFLPSLSGDEIQVEVEALAHVESTQFDGVVAIPGAAALLARLNECGVPWGIVTSGARKVATARLNHLGFPIPSVFITCESITRGKPDPEPFQLGAKALGLTPGQCIAFEDSEAGLLSAKSAGCTVIHVTAAGAYAAPGFPSVASFDNVIVVKSGGNVALTF